MLTRLLFKFTDRRFVRQVDLTAGNNFVSCFQATDHLYTVSVIYTTLNFGQVGYVIADYKYCIITYTAYKCLTWNGKNTATAASAEDCSSVHSCFQFVEGIRNSNFYRELKRSGS